MNPPLIIGIRDLAAQTAWQVVNVIDQQTGYPLGIQRKDENGDNLGDVIPHVGEGSWTTITANVSPPSP